jgi:hypothetical protein
VIAYRHQGADPILSHVPTRKNLQTFLKWYDRI